MLLACKAIRINKQFQHVARWWLNVVLAFAVWADGLYIRTSATNKKLFYCILFLYNSKSEFGMTYFVFLFVLLLFLFCPFEDCVVVVGGRLLLSLLFLYISAVNLTGQMFKLKHFSDKLLSFNLIWRTIMVKINSRKTFVKVSECVYASVSVTFFCFSL